MVISSLPSPAAAAAAAVVHNDFAKLGPDLLLSVSYPRTSPWRAAEAKCLSFLEAKSFARPRVDLGKPAPAPFVAASPSDKPTSMVSKLLMSPVMLARPGADGGCLDPILEPVAILAILSPGGYWCSGGNCDDRQRGV